MKKIGIILHDEVINNKTYKILNTDFIKYLSNYDVVIIGIIYDEETDINKILEQINMCDGIIIPGGNIYSDIDKRIARYLYDIDKPTLGICLGMQIMGEALGGKIEILDNLNHITNDEYAHYVRIKKDTKLYYILNAELINVNSRHKYHLVNTNLTVNAYSNDYIIEGIESKDKKFYIGVQYHPESIYYDINSKLLIEEFIKCLTI